MRYSRSARNLELNPALVRGAGCRSTAASTNIGADFGYSTDSKVPRGALHPRQETQPPEALSAGADAGAAVPVQSRLRGLRKDRLSEGHPAEAGLRGGCAARGRRVRGA